MLEFSRKDFDKNIKLNPKQNIESKWDLVRLEKVVETQYGYTANAEDEGDVRYLRITDITEDGRLKNTDKKYINPSEQIIQDYTLNQNDIVIARSGSTGRMLLYKGIDEQLIFASYLVRLKVSEEILPEYVFAFHYTIDYWKQVDALTTTLAQPNLNAERMKQIKIPLPPLAVQQQIADECDAVDQETDQAHQTITTTRQQIEELVSSVENTSTLDQVVDKISDIVDPQEENGIVSYIGLENIESKTGVLLGGIQTDYSTIKSNKNVFRIGDILYGKLRPNLNKVFLANIDGICSTDILVLRPTNPNLAIFYKHYLLSEAFNSVVLTTVSGQQLPRTSWEKINRNPCPTAEYPTAVSRRS